MRSSPIDNAAAGVARLIAIALVAAACKGTTEVAKVCTTSAIVVAPQSQSVFVGGTAQLSAAPTTQNCTVAPTVAWTSSAGSVASVNSSGLVSGLTAGTALITATSGGISGSAAITVTVQPVASLVVTLPSASSVGATVTPTIEVRASDNTLLTGRAISYSSATPGVATITNSTTGAITGVGPGTTVITATSEGISGTATLTVLPTAEATRFAFVFGDNATAAINSAYTPNPNYSQNISGGTLSVTHTGVGTYSVLLGKMAKVGSIPQDAVIVQSEGETPVLCRMDSWATTNANDATAFVRCANFAGTLVDAVFDILWVGSKTLPGANAFFWNPNAGASNTGNNLYYFSSTSTAPTLTRLSAGQYQFDMGTGNIGRSTALVAAYQGTRACPLQSWNTTTSAILVNCYTPLSSSQVDNLATVLLLSQGRTGKRWGFLQIENASAALNVTQTANTATQNQSNGLATTYSRIATGRYRIRFTGLAATFKESMFVTGIGLSHCQPITWVNDTGDILADVQCFSIITGVAADTKLAVFFVE